VPGVDGTSWNNKRPRGVAECLQVRKHFVEAQTDVPSNILSKHPSGPEFFDKTAHFRPEVTVIFRASTLPGCTEWLAGVSSANKVNWSNIFATQLPHVFKLGNIRPVFLKYSTAKRVDFTLGNNGHPSPLQANVHPAYSCEK
jgi:hypothetical protein